MAKWSGDGDLGRYGQNVIAKDLLVRIGFRPEDLYDLDYGGYCCWGDIHATWSGLGFFISVKTRVQWESIKGSREANWNPKYRGKGAPQFIEGLTKCNLLRLPVHFIRWLTISMDLNSYQAYIGLLPEMVISGKQHEWWVPMRPPDRQRESYWCITETGTHQFPWKAYKDDPFDRYWGGRPPRVHERRFDPLRCPGLVVDNYIENAEPSWEQWSDFERTAKVPDAD